MPDFELAGSNGTDVPYQTYDSEQINVLRSFLRMPSPAWRLR